MGFLAKLLSFTRVTRNSANISDVKVDPGGGSNVVVEHYGPAGDDSHPLPSDAVACIRNSLHRATAVGYADTVNEPAALAGEKRIYARDSSGAVITTLWLRNTGIIEVNGVADYAVRYNVLKAQFDILNTAYNTHTHPGGGVPSPQSAADLTLAKVDEVMLP